MIDVLAQLTEDEIKSMDYETLCLVESLVLNEATISQLVNWFIKQTGTGQSGNVDPGKFFGDAPISQDDGAPFPSSKARVNAFLTGVMNAKGTDVRVRRDGRGRYTLTKLSPQQKDILLYFSKRDPSVWEDLLGETPEASTADIARAEAERIGYKPGQAGQKRAHPAKEEDIFGRR